MSFVVTARTATLPSAREVAFSLRSALAATEKCLALLGAGMTEVRAVDAAGRAYTAAELGALLFGRDVPARG